MKKIITLLLFLTFSTTFSQEKNGDREGTIFYPTIERTEKAYNIVVDLYELGTVKYIEVELYDENEVKLSDKLVKLIVKDKKYYIAEDDKVGVEVVIQNINLKLENPNNSLNYPKVKIKLLDENYAVLDYSQKTFY